MSKVPGRSDMRTNERLWLEADNNGMVNALELGDKIIVSVLIMRCVGAKKGAIIEQHSEWFNRLLKYAESVS